MNKLAFPKSLFFLFLLISMFFLAHSKFIEYSYKKSTNINNHRSYAEEWKSIDSLEKKQLYKKALMKLQAIYAHAKSQKNSPQQIKTILFRLKYKNILEEDALENYLADLTDEITQADGNVSLQSILYSVKAQIIWSIYKQNRFNILERTISNDGESDINTWDAARFMDESRKNFFLSLSEKEKLKKIPVDLYSDVLEGDSLYRLYRPSLYDLLVHCFIDFLSDSESSLNKPIEPFEMDNVNYFSSANRFIGINLHSTDSFSSSLLILKLYQDLLSFHKNDLNTAAFIDADLGRLNYVERNYKGMNGMKHYIDALNALNKRLNGKENADLVLIKLAEFYENQGMNYDIYEHNHTYQPFLKMADDFYSLLIKKYPNSIYVPDAMNGIQRIQEPSLSFLTEDVYSSDISNLFLLKYKNIAKAHFKLIPISYNQLKRKEQNLINKWLLKQKSLYEWAVDLPDDGLYHAHDVELELAPLKKGFYVLLCSDSSNFSENSATSYSSFFVSNLSYVTRTPFHKGLFECLVLDRNSGKPISDAEVFFYNSSFNYKKNKFEINWVKKQTSDKYGRVFYENFSDSYTDFSMRISKGDDWLMVDDLFSVYTKKNTSSEQTKTFFFTDRKIYRPGQTVYYKAIRIKGTTTNNEILPNWNCIVRFNDINSNEIERHECITNEFGSYAGSFKIPVRGSTGLYTIQDEYGEISFRVEEYKRPKFEVTIDEPISTYRIKDRIRVSGSAQSLAGFSISNALLEYRIVRIDKFPSWYSSFPSKKQEVSYGKMRTDSEGKFSFDFVALPENDLSDLSQSSKFKISVDVTDETGETRSAEQVLVVTNSTLHIEASIPKLLCINERKAWNIIVKNTNGYAVGSDVFVRVEKMHQPTKIYRKKLWDTPDVFVINKSEYEQKFPFDSYDDKFSQTKLPVERIMYDGTIHTNDSNSFYLNTDGYESGLYRANFSVVDDFGTKSVKSYLFHVYDKKNSKSAFSDIFFVSPLKNTYEVGSIAEVLIASSKNIHVLYEIEHNERLIKKEYIKLNKTQKILSIPILNEFEGDIHIMLSCIYSGRSYLNSFRINVPYSSKKLDVKLETFRDKLLPGSKEIWKIGLSPISSFSNESEFLVSMYDASLDAYMDNNWYFDLWHPNSFQYKWVSKQDNLSSSDILSEHYSTSYNSHNFTYEGLNLYGLTYSLGRRNYAKTKYYAPEEGSYAMMSAPAVLEEYVEDENYSTDSEAPNFVPRSNFNETAFFYPQLKSNYNGSVGFSFSMPDALTKWKFMALAHNKDLKSGYLTKEVITQKELMINTSAPRFFREGDEFYFTAKVTNLSSHDLQGIASLSLYDPITNINMDSAFHLSAIKLPFSVSKGQSIPLEWKMRIPASYSSVRYTAKASSEKFSDAEENTVPIVTNRQLITETYPLWVNGNDSKTFTFPTLSLTSKTNTFRQIRLEFTSNPAWYALQSLPYLMEYPYECAEQTFNRFFANSIAAHIAQSDPRMEKIFKKWNLNEPDALKSKLEKNQQIKNILLEETPWVREATNESERIKRLGVLFDINRMKNECMANQQKLSDMQLRNGAFPWFAGGMEDRYITQYIVAGFGRLQKVGVFLEPHNGMIENAISYLDNKMKMDYISLKRNKKPLNENNLNSIHIHYLYARSFFKTIPFTLENNEALTYYFRQAEKYWNSKNNYEQGMIALVMYRMNKNELSIQILDALKEKSIVSDELGMYWKGMLQGGYHWNESPIETMSLLIEAFDEIKHDTVSIDAMKQWLMKNKQTTNWETTKATADACYALLLQGTDMLSTESDLTIRIGKGSFYTFNNTESGTGYFHSSLPFDKVYNRTNSIKLSKSSPGSAYGAIYYQYTEELDKVKSQNTSNPLSVSKQIFRETKTNNGLILEEISNSTTLSPGDRIISRIIFSSDRPMEYVHIKDMRASGLEPESVLSQYKFRQGLSYYESTKDLATHYFISYVPRGTYIFEYPLRVTHYGIFSNGITQIQCMYAPEFTSHTVGIKITVNKND